jgi:hypothetical protein
MENWKKLDDLDERNAWGFITNKLNFQPYNKECIVRLPSPNKVFEISKYYDEGFNEELYSNLHESILSLFKKIAKGGRMYALNWQHDCYSFSPYLLFEKDEFDEWLVPVFPNGDYLFFLTEDFDNGIFADGVNLKFSIWGENIVTALEYEVPIMLQ